MEKDFTVHRRVSPSNLRCLVRNVNGQIVISRRRGEPYWRVWLDFPEPKSLSASTLKAAIVAWKLSR